MSNARKMPLGVCAGDLRRSLAVCALGAALVAAPGCDDNDPAAKAIVEAETALAVLHTTGVYADGHEGRRRVYSGVLSSLRTAADEGNEGQQVAAYSLMSQAHAGQAQIETSEAADLESQALRDASVARSVLNELVVAMRAQAEAATSVASTADQQRLEAQGRALDSERTERLNELRRLQGQIDALRQRVSEARTAAEEHRKREAAMRLELLDTEGGARADLSIRAVDAQRQADLRERDAAELEATLVTLRPQASQLEMEIESLTTRIDMLASSRQRMRQRDTVVREQANAQLAKAETASRQLDTTIVEMDEFRQGELKSAYEAAERTHRQAIDAMRRASSGRGAGADWRTATMISLAGLHERLGDLHTARADGQDRYAMLLERLADPAQGLSRAGTYRQYLERVRSDAKAQREAARGAYTEAATAYRSAGARGDSARRIEAILRGLDAVTGQGGDEAAQDADF